MAAELRDCLAANGILDTAAHEVATQEDVRALLKAGLGVAIMPVGAMEMNGLNQIPLNHLNLMRRGVGVYRRGPAARNLCHTLQSAASRRLGHQQRLEAAEKTLLMAKLSAVLEVSFARCRDMEAPLADRLKAFENELRRVVPSFAEAVDTLVSRLAESNAGAAAPKVGEPMPTFLLPDEQGRLVRLEDFLRNGPLALAFNRGHWCPYCRINIDALARAEEKVAAEHRHIAAIVPDRQRFAMWLKSDAKAPFPVLTDMDNGYAMTLGLAIYVGDELKRMMLSSGWDPSVSQGSENWMLPIPATFIIGTDGIVCARFVDPDYRMRMTVEHMLTALRSAT
jgi:peroxiredoxin